VKLQIQLVKLLTANNNNNKIIKKILTHPSTPENLSTSRQIFTYMSGIAMDCPENPKKKTKRLSKKSQEALGLFGIS